MAESEGFGRAAARRDGLASLLRLGRLGAGADHVIAVSIGSDGVAIPVAADPGFVPPGFLWPSTTAGPSASPSSPAHLGLPPSVTLATGQPARAALVALPPRVAGDAAALILLWHAERPDWTAERAEAFELVSAAAGEALAARSLLMRQVEARFHDLFESVPLGIVVIDGSGRAPQVNERAAALLGLASGIVDAARLADAMRRLRERCSNAAELAANYRAFGTELDYAATLLWQLGDRVLQVDSHPVLGDGRSGRIWLFHDVTAQQTIEADLRRLAGQDPLTGLANRRSFEAAAEQAFVQGDPMALVMIDIDFFKRINDEHGHAVGDTVLAQVAARLGGALRERDHVARIGGEEFACLLPGTEPEVVAAIAERLRATIELAPVVTGIRAIDVRISLGVASRAPSDRSFSALYARADSALYAAKRLGRNRVAMAP